MRRLSGVCTAVVMKFPLSAGDAHERLPEILRELEAARSK